MQTIIHWDIVFEAMRWKLLEELKRRAPVHDSNLRQSIKGKIVDDSFLISMVDYAIYVETGTRPHWTSVENLKKWAKDKLGDESAAYALQRYIAKFGCFFGNSHRYKVLTKRGYKSLKDVKVGDLVLTHKDRWREVTAKPIHKVGYKIPRYTVELENGKKVTVTEEHPFYCKKDDKFKWIKAKDLTEDDVILEVL